MYQQSLLALPEVERVSGDYVMPAKIQISIWVNFEVNRCCGLNFFVIRCALFLVIDYHCRPLSAIPSELFGFHRRPHLMRIGIISLSLHTTKVAFATSNTWTFHLYIRYFSYIKFVKSTLLLLFKVTRKRNPFTQCNGVCCWESWLDQHEDCPVILCLCDFDRKCGSR